MAVYLNQPNSKPTKMPPGYKLKAPRTRGDTQPRGAWSLATPSFPEFASTFSPNSPSPSSCRWSTPDPFQILLKWSIKMLSLPPSIFEQFWCQKRKRKAHPDNPQGHRATGHRYLLSPWAHCVLGPGGHREGPRRSWCLAHSLLIPNQLSGFDPAFLPPTDSEVCGAHLGPT